jgi:hypothetical protein
VITTVAGAAGHHGAHPEPNNNNNNNTDMNQIIHTTCNDWTKEANADDVTYIITTSCGCWGRGATVEDAIKTTASAGAMRSSKAVIAIIVGGRVDDCYVDDYGSICYDSGAICNSVAVAKFSAIESIN